MAIFISQRNPLRYVIEIHESNRSFVENNDLTSLRVIFAFLENM